MARKKSQHKILSASRRPTTASPGLRWRSVVIALVVVVAGVVAAKLVMQSRSRARIEKPPVSTEASFEATPSSGDTAWDASWPALPQTGKPARPIEVVKAAYAYAVRREDVLKYMPCYCGCEKQGHRSNHDCFVRGKTAAGAPAWDPMGYT